MSMKFEYSEAGIEVSKTLKLLKLFFVKLPTGSVSSVPIMGDERLF